MIVQLVAGWFIGGVLARLVHALFIGFGLLVTLAIRYPAPAALVAVIVAVKFGAVHVFR